VKKQPLLQ